MNNLDEAQKNARIDAYNDRVSNAWRGPTTSSEAAANANRLRDKTLAKLSDPYERRDHQLENAWR